MNWELPDVQARFRKGRGSRYQIAKIHWIIEKAREFQENICFIDYAKAFDCVDHNELWKILQEMGIPDHFTCLRRNLYAGQEAVRTGHVTTDWFQIRNLTSLLLVYGSVQFSHSVVSSSLWPHILQHTRLPYPSPNPGVYPNSCPSSWWCHPTISSSVVPFSSCLQSFQHWGLF